MASEPTTHEQVITDLRKSLAWMDLVLSNLSEGVLVVGKDMHVLFANDAIATTLGKERIFLLGLPIWKALPIRNSSHALIKQVYVAALAKNNFTSFSGIYTLKKTNVELIVDVRVGFIKKIDQTVFVVRDITKQRQDEQALIDERIARIREQTARQKFEESEKLLQTIINGSTAVIYMKDLKGKYITVNSQYEKLFNVSRKNVKGKTDYDILPKEIAQTVRSNDQQVLQAKKTLEWEEVIPLKDGLHTYLSVKFPLFDANNQPYAVCGISTDITERKELEKRKDDFINMASHELKTPVTSMKVFNQITKKLATKGEIKRSLYYFSKIDDQMNKLSKLIGELLNLSRIQAGKLELQKEAFDLDHLIKDTVENVKTTTTKHTLQIKGKIRMQIFADPDRVGQVLINLLTNAIKYSPQGGKIIVTVENKDDVVLIAVQDFGIGIAKENQAKIFDRFYQVTDPAEKTFPGLGIGLYIAAEIIKRHGGTIQVKSAKGKGSTFSFTLPTGR
jgi:PAS domain S-box-containing protein